MALANHHQLTNIAFPAISTGVYHFPVQRAAVIVYDVLKSLAAQSTSVQQVDLVSFDARTAQIYEAVFNENQ